MAPPSPSPEDFKCSKEVYEIFLSIYACFLEGKEEIFPKWEVWLQEGKEHHAAQPEGDSKEAIRLFLDFVQKHYQPSPVSVAPVPVVSGSDISGCPDDCDIPGCPECYGGAYSMPVE